jgi:Tol biopolymer transport system component
MPLRAGIGMPPYGKFGSIENSNKKDKNVDTPELNDSVEFIANQSKTPKLWLLTIPLLGACVLSTCLASAGLFLWLKSDSPAGQELSPARERVDLPQATIKDSLSIPASPLAEPGPTPSLAQASQPDPVACQSSSITGQISVDGPVLSPVSFATRQDDRGWPLDASLQFTSAITTVQASFSYLGLRNGLNWERVWYFDEQEMLRGRGVWDAGPQGELTLSVQLAEGGFVPGNYRLEIYVAGELLGQGSFDVVAEDAPTRQAVQVAYTTWDGRRHQLNLLNLDDKQTETLLEFARQPAWSPDAIGLLFLGEPGLEAGTPGLYVLNLGQRQTYQLSEQTFFDSLAWSPQRTFVATSIRQGQTSHLRLWQLAENQPYDGPSGEEPAWSPEGRRLAYRTCYDGRWSISTIRVISNVFDLDSIQPLTMGDDRQPAWSPDGQQIAFVRNEAGNQDIYTVAVDGADLRRLTTDPASDTTPAWTPDGRLVFRSQRDGEWGLYVMNADGSDPQPLASTPSAPDWQPDRLAVSTDTVPAELIPAKPKVQIPAGHGMLVISNQKNNDEMTFTIDNQEHKIGPYQFKFLALRPGHYTWTASWPGKTSRTGIADLANGQVAYPVVER